ncbi:MAG: Flp family type IVb pilin [Pyrinomonadaceae bacterium]
MIKKFLRDETGLELSEYAVAGALIVAAGVAVFTALGGAIAARITAITNAITP